MNSDYVIEEVLTMRLLKLWALIMG